MPHQWQEAFRRDHCPIVEAAGDFQIYDAHAVGRKVDLAGSNSLPKKAASGRRTPRSYCRQQRNGNENHYTTISKQTEKTLKAYPIFSTFNLGSAVQMRATSVQDSKVFQPRSSSVIFGQVARNSSWASRTLE